MIPGIGSSNWRSLEMTSLPNCALWIDASDLSTITHTNSAVSQINDKSGNLRHLSQGTSVNRPLAVTSQNGLTVLDFDGVNDSLVRTGGTNLGRNTSAITVHVVARIRKPWQSTNPAQIFFLSTNASASTSRLSIEVGRYVTPEHSNRIGCGARRLHEDPFIYLAAPNVCNASFTVISVVMDYADTRLRLYLNGALVSSFTNYLTAGYTVDAANLAFSIGANPSAQYFLDGQIAELAAFHEAHSPDLVANIAASLRNKWGLPEASGHITWQTPADIGTGTTSLANPSGQHIYSAMKFVNVGGNAGGHRFLLDSCDNESGEGSGIFLYTNSDSDFQTIADSLEWRTSSAGGGNRDNEQALTLKNLLKYEKYALQLYVIDKRAGSGSRQQKFIDAYGNESSVVQHNAEKYVIGEFTAAHPFPRVYAKWIGGDTDASIINLAVLRQIGEASFLRSLPGYLLHFDADERTMTHTNGAVLEWRDKAGYQTRITQATHTARPTILKHPYNGLPVLDFTNQNLKTTSLPTGLLKNVSGCTMYVVANVDDASTQRQTVIITNNVSNLTRAGLIFANPTANKVSAGGRRLDGDTFATAQSSSNVTSGWQSYTALFDYANSNAYIYVRDRLEGSNTSFQTDGNTSNTNAAALAVGSSAPNTSYYDGKIAEIIIFDAAHTEEQRSQVWSYLALKWGLGGPVTWQAPADIGSGTSSLDTPEGQVVEYGWRFTSTSGTVNGIEFVLASCVNETAEETSGLSYTNSDATFQALLNSCEYTYPYQKLQVELTGLTAGNRYAVQLFFVDKRSGFADRHHRFSDSYGNASESFRVGDEKYVVGEFIASGPTQNVFVEYTSGPTPAAHLSLLVLRRFT